MTDIVEIEGVGEAYGGQLRSAGIPSVEELLQRGATPKGRDEIAQTTGISGQLILRWVNHADLFRIKGVASEYSELLEAAGVDTVVELAQRNAANLYQSLTDTNTSKKLVRQLPTAAQVADWVEQAKSLPRQVSY
jgi:predicted flap endonuclease-1-like 5' DNA nuclease